MGNNNKKVPTSIPDVSQSIETTIHREASGFGLNLIQNGNYVQILSIDENAALAKSGFLEAGDILAAVNDVNIMHLTLEEVKGFFCVATGSAVKIKAYRDVIELPCVNFGKLTCCRKKKKITGFQCFTYIQKKTK
ncbi:hypothetical protein XENTR_v10008240 [Xenopus tropicalis]|uniref:PDZ domain-containing protein 9-like isoform X2 n=1 Tax=Xenopus tropicalis TaxID=8364 RepID=A0A8J1JDG1_XENTR|nr:PDZ domain-containing protein 9-like isoform X2 [Xenopus tropicalis]XP_031754672.1 PDZ domain-containing protein 9-like isoform X2 [Xenopus tropicalis]KAE8614619.1 hypothetical protein XENTR_v10008240 [Xenopus tropicalis]KAE8614620.1 hypothetical protein XENTR_v10008240 [Xenopus tropicalis]